MQAQQLDSVLHAISDQTRRAILDRLASGPSRVTDLAGPFSISLNAVSKHIKVLEQAGLITRSRAAQQRPCRLSPEGFKEVDDWLQHYRATWEQRLDRLADYLSTLKE